MGEPQEELARTQQREQERRRTLAIVADAILRGPLGTEQKGMLIELMFDALRVDRRRSTLLKELQAAEIALGTDPSAGNFSWLRDIQRQLKLIDDSE